jgi:hypothetical protein
MLPSSLLWSTTWWHMHCDQVKRLERLRALYQQGHAQNDFSECIQQCKHDLESEKTPLWRVKMFCVLVASYQHDWQEAEVRARSFDQPLRWSNTKEHNPE